MTNHPPSAPPPEPTSSDRSTANSLHQSSDPATTSANLDQGWISGQEPTASPHRTPSAGEQSTRRPRALFRQDVFFDSWSEWATEPKRQQLNQKIKIAESCIRQARVKIAAIPRQVEETDHLLKFLRANFFIHDAIIESSSPLMPYQAAESEDYATLVKDIEITQEALSKVLQDVPAEQQQFEDAEPFVFEALKLAEEFVNHIENQAEAQKIAADSALQEQVDQITTELTQQITNIRTSFEPDKNSSVLDEELNRLQLLLHTLRYEVNTTHRLATLKRLESVIEEISGTVKSIHADQRSVFSLVQATEISVDRWLHRYYFEIPGLRWVPTGWIIGFWPNRYRDLGRLFRKMSGTDDDYSSRQTTTQGRILAGLTVSLIGWLSITFLISSGVLLAKIFLQSVTAGRADRIESANADLEQVAQTIQDIINTSTISQGINNLPENNAIAVQNSRQQIGQILNIFTLFADNETVDLSSCEQLTNNLGDTPLSDLIDDCRAQISNINLQAESGEQNLATYFNNLPNTPLSAADNPLETFQQQLSNTLNIALDDLVANAQIDTTLRTVSPNSLVGEIGTLSQQIRNQIQGLSGNADLAYVLQILEEDRSNLKVAEVDGELQIVFDDGNGDRQLVTDATSSEGVDFSDTAVQASFMTALEEVVQIKRSDERLERLTNTALRWTQEPVYTNNINRLLLALLAGALGGMVSVLTRIEAVEKDYTINSPFLYGLLQPLIGAAFSLIVMMVLSTDLVEVIKVLPREFHLTRNRGSAEETLYIQNDEGRFVEADIRPLNQEDVLTTEEVFVILVAGFIVGFSERLAKNAFVTVDTGSSISK